MLWQDARYAVRGLLKTPAVTFVAVLSLALGIGANTAIFSVGNALFLRSLPVRDPGRLLEISTVYPERPGRYDPVPLRSLDEIRCRNQVFSAVAAFEYDSSLRNIEANGFKYIGSVSPVSGDFFAILGVAPLIGRTITPQDAATSAPVAVLDYRCWRERFGGDPNVLGKTLRADGKLLTVVGVAPKAFIGLHIDSAGEAFVPMGVLGGIAGAAGDPWGHAVGRLKPGVTLEQARAHLQTLWPAIQAATVPEKSTPAQRSRFLKRRMDVRPAGAGHSYLRGKLLYPLAVLGGVVGLVLLIACVNLANLVLARTAARRREFAVRVALGAGRWNLMRPVLVETLLLSTAGAMLGLLSAFWAPAFLLRMSWRGLGRLALDLTPDLHVLAFTAGVAVVTGILFGLGPAWRAAGSAPAPALHSSERSIAGGFRAGKMLVIAQVALSIVLVIGASWFAGSLGQLRSTDPGYRRAGVLTMLLFPQTGREEIPNRTAYFRRVADELSRLPGVQAVSYSESAPCYPTEFYEPVTVPGSGAQAEALREWVGPNFFRLLDMRVLAGREFGWRDDQGASRVAIVSESLARRLFPGRNPLGQRIDVGAGVRDKGLEIVGVVNSASLWRVQTREPLAVYVPHLQQPGLNQPMLELRVAGDPRAVVPAAERVVESLGHHSCLRAQSLEERHRAFLSNERMIALLSTFFGALSLLLAAVGLYGVMYYTVSRRTAEIGIRMALGATSGKVLGLVVREALVLVVTGISLGLPAALAASRLVSGMLYGVTAGDPRPILLAATVVSCVGLVAGYLPARRASRVDPMAALRAE